MWGERPPDPYLPLSMGKVVHDKLVKIWDEPAKSEEIQALLNLIGKADFNIWWDPIARNWQFCRTRMRFAKGVIHRAVPHDGSFRRWQHELSQLEPAIPEPEW